MQTALAIKYVNTRQATVTYGSLTIANTDGVQTALSNKAPFSAIGVDTNYASSANTALALKAPIHNPTCTGTVHVGQVVVGGALEIRDTAVGASNNVTSYIKSRGASGFNRLHLQALGNAEAQIWTGAGSGFVLRSNNNQSI